MHDQHSQSPHVTYLPDHVLDHPDLQEAAWAAATSFGQVAHLTGCWARGELDRLPGGGRAPERVLDVRDRVRGLADWGMAVLDAQGGADEGYREMRAYVSILLAQDDVTPLTRSCEDAGLLVLPFGPSARPRSVAATRWDGDDEAASRVYPETELIKRLARSVDPRAAAEITLRTTHMLVVDPHWGRDDVLWATLAAFCRTRAASSPEVGTDPFSVAFRVDEARRPVTQAIDAWVSTLLDEVHEQIRPYRRPSSPCLALLPAEVPRDGDAVSWPGPGPATLLHRAPDTERCLEPIIALDVLWAELNRALRVITGDPGPFSLVINPDTLTVVGWWPQWCPTHGNNNPVAWWQAGVGTLHPSVLADGDVDTLGELPPEDTPDGVMNIRSMLRRWGVAPPTTPIDC